MTNKDKKNSLKLTLVAETNFVLDIVFQRDSNCEYILEFVNSLLIRVAMPEYALVEAEITVEQVLRRRIQRIEDAQRALQQANRSNYHHWTDLMNRLEGFKQYVIDIELPMVRQQIQNIREIVTVIPFTPDAMANAELRELGDTAPFKKSDRRIYESILLFADQNRSESVQLLFLTKDQEDFDIPSIHEEMAAIGVEIFFSSGRCVRRLRDLLGFS